MINHVQIASFAMMQMELFLQGLTEADAQKRLAKADGSQMNGISFIVGHVAWQWISLATRAAIAQANPRPPEEAYPELRARVWPFRNGTDDPTPPSLAEAFSVLHEARELTRWLITADEAVMLAVVPLAADRRPAAPADMARRARNAEETLGTRIIRNTLHTLIHSGEINAIRQVLGHPEIPFVTQMPGNMEWQPEGSLQPAFVQGPAAVSS